MQNGKLVEKYIEQYKGAGKRELLARLATLKTKASTQNTKAEIAAINALLP